MITMSMAFSVLEGIDKYFSNRLFVSGSFMYCIIHSILSFSEF